MRGHGRETVTSLVYNNVDVVPVQFFNEWYVLS